MFKCEECGEFCDKAGHVNLREDDPAVYSLTEYREFIKALDWLNDQMDKHKEAEWLMLLIKRQYSHYIAGNLNAMP